MSYEDRSVLYKIRWEILVIAVSLILSAVVVLAIPADFSEKMLREQREQREMMEKKLANLEPESGLEAGEEKKP